MGSTRCTVLVASQKYPTRVASASAPVVANIGPTMMAPTGEAFIPVPVGSRPLKVARPVAHRASPVTRKPVPSVPSVIVATTVGMGMSLRLLKFSGGSIDDYAICRSS